MSKQLEAIASALYVLLDGQLDVGRVRHHIAVEDAKKELRDAFAETTVSTRPTCSYVSETAVGTAPTPLDPSPVIETESRARCQDFYEIRFHYVPSDHSSCADAFYVLDNFVGEFDVRDLDLSGRLAVVAAAHILSGVRKTS